MENDGNELIRSFFSNWWIFFHFRSEPPPPKLSRRGAQASIKEDHSLHSLLPPKFPYVLNARTYTPVRITLTFAPALSYSLSSSLFFFTLILLCGASRRWRYLRFYSPWFTPIMQCLFISWTRGCAMTRFCNRTQFSLFFFPDAWYAAISLCSE